MTFLIPLAFAALGLCTLGAGIMAQNFADEGDYNTSAVALVIGLSLIAATTALAVLT